MYLPRFTLMKSAVETGYNKLMRASVYPVLIRFISTKHTVSFIFQFWLQTKQDDAVKVYQPLRKKLQPKSLVTVPDILAARDNLLVIDKTSSNRKGSETHINKIIMGDVSTCTLYI